MKLLLPLLSVVTAVGLTIPAHADDTNSASGAEGIATADLAGISNDAAFLASLRGAGIGFSNEERAIGAAKAMCGLIDRGESGLQVIGEIRGNNPGLSMENATRFAKIAADAYCQHQLVVKDN